MEHKLLHILRFLELMPVLWAVVIFAIAYVIYRAGTKR